MWRLAACLVLVILVTLIVTQLHIRGPVAARALPLINNDWRLEPIRQTFMISVNRKRLTQQRKTFAAAGLTFVSTLDDLHLPVRPTAEFVQSGAINEKSGLWTSDLLLSDGRPDPRRTDIGCLFSHMMLWRHLLLLDHVSIDDWFVILEDDAALRFDASQHGESERHLKQLLARPGAEMIWLSERVYTNLAGAVIGSGTEGYAVKRSAIAHLIDVMTPASAPVDMQLLAWTEGTTWGTQRNRGPHDKTPIRGYVSPRPFIIHDVVLAGTK